MVCFKFCKAFLKTAFGFPNGDPNYRRHKIETKFETKTYDFSSWYLDFKDTVKIEIIFCS